MSVSLAAVLREFVSVLQNVCKRDGSRIVAYHLELDAGIIKRELRTSGLDDSEWSRAARSRGFCTMCPELGRWISHCVGRDAGSET